MRRKLMIEIAMVSWKMSRYLCFNNNHLKNKVCIPFKIPGFIDQNPLLSQNLT